MKYNKAYALFLVTIPYACSSHASDKTPEQRAEKHKKKFEVLLMDPEFKRSYVLMQIEAQKTPEYQEFIRELRRNQMQEQMQEFKKKAPIVASILVSGAFVCGIIGYVIGRRSR